MPISTSTSPATTGRGEDFPDGLASDRERQAQLPSFGKHVDKINDQMIRMQRDYARALLTHTNAYTHTRYTKEPCVAVIEINNENSLMELKVNSLPEYYRNDVLKKWNQWLKKRYGSSEKLTAAWGGREELGTNIITVQPIAQGREYLAVSNAGAGETHISLLKSPEVSWHAQVLWTGLTLNEGRLYTLNFSARSDQPRRLPLSVRLNRPNWNNCGLSEDAPIGPEWKSFTYSFRAAHGKPGDVRLDMDAGGGPVGDFSIKELALRPGGTLGLTPGESLEAGSVQAPANTGGTPRGLAWTQFLAESERAYSDGMRSFLKKDLGVEANLVDSQASYGGIAGAYRESFSDYVDMHAYWQHPEFPGRPWDLANWNIRNTPMVADPHGGTLPELAFYRQMDKPFTVSEYDHPAPTHYAAEMFPIISSFAALQDWDGVFQFDWGSPDFDAQRIGNFFSLQQHPGKLAFLPAAALMFRRGDVAAATATARLMIPGTQVEELTANHVSMAEAWREAGVSLTNLLNHRLQLGFLESPVPITTSPRAQVDPSSSSPLSWDAAAGLYTVDAPAAKAVVGRCTGKSTQLEGAVFDVQTNARNYAVLTLNAMDARPLAQSHRLLLTAAGNVENTGMGWNAAHTSVGNHWGKAPTLCEGIGAKVGISTSAKTAKVYALDGSGARAGELPAALANGKLSFEIGPQFKTLWYEIAAD